MSDCHHMRNGYIRWTLFLLLLGLPVIANGKEPTPATGDKNSKVAQPAKADPGLTFSDVMNWAQRFGNRVGENISEAASKSASAIKEAASDNQQDPKLQSENSP